MIGIMCHELMQISKCDNLKHYFTLDLIHLRKIIIDSPNVLIINMLNST